MPPTTATKAPTSRWRVWGRRIGLPLMSLTIGLVCFEIGLRLIGFHYATFGIPDAVRGWSLSPGFADVYTLEGRAHVAINSHGYRDRERSRSKPDNVFRIAVLGDSFVEARQIELDDTFCGVLERTLNAAGTYSPKRVEVLNFGVAGYGTAQEYMTLRDDVLSFEPDVVLLAVWSGNDLLDDSRPLDLSPKRAWRPYYTVANDQLILDDSFQDAPSYRRHTSIWGRLAYQLRGNLRLVQLAIAVVYKATDPRMRPEWRWQDELGVSSDVYKKPTTADWIDAWQLTERLMLEMSRLCQARGVGFGVVTLSNGVQVYPDAKIRKELSDELKVADLFYPERRIAKFGEAAKVPVLNLAPEMQKAADASGTYFHGFSNTHLGWGHWNRDGHEFAGRRIAGWLAEPAVKSQLSPDAATSR